MLVVLVSILGWSVQAVDDAEVVIQRYPIHAQLETYLMISQAKVTCQHSVEHVALQQWCESECHPVRPLNVIHERQYCRLNYQTEEANLQSLFGITTRVLLLS
ncbi:hypothetical protein TNCV_4386351 [Trichonephila clavipes]|nr:hypothetical protein TNCV_4386351 [Trichonephila clavipes]